jgi:hypothetical protein
MIACKTVYGVLICACHAASLGHWLPKNWSGVQLARYWTLARIEHYISQGIQLQTEAYWSSAILYFFYRLTNKQNLTINVVAGKQSRNCREVNLFEEYWYFGLFKQQPLDNRRAMIYALRGFFFTNTNRQVFTLLTQMHKQHWLTYLAVPTGSYRRLLDAASRCYTIRQRWKFRS